MTDSLYPEPSLFRFSTKYYDVETGLSDFGKRYYHATLGRWLNRDPLGELGGANVYAYVGNNPLNRVDYLGITGDRHQLPHRFLTAPTGPAHLGRATGP